MITLILLSLAALCLAVIDREIPEENEMATLDILTTLVKGGMSTVGACAMGGNMMAESAMKSINLQDSYQKKLGYTDESYTSSVDSGNYTRAQFLADQAGYGLCQWTYHVRKANLYDFAKSRKTSIGDELMQVDFCLRELQNEYAALWNYLQITNDLHAATERNCKEFERPAVNNVNTRSANAWTMYAQYGDLLEALAKGAGVPVEDDADREPKAYIMGTVRYGEHTPEAAFLMGHLNKLGYDVLWEGLNNCVRDFQQKRGLDVDGIVGEKTWGEVLK